MAISPRLKLSGIPFSSVLQDAGFHRRLTWDIAGAVMATQMRVTVVSGRPSNHLAVNLAPVPRHFDLRSLSRLGTWDGMDV